jgi:TM2 domain-containing membrane protein YozV
VNEAIPCALNAAVAIGVAVILTVPFVFNGYSFADKYFTEVSVDGKATLTLNAAKPPVTVPKETGVPVVVIGETNAPIVSKQESKEEAVAEAAAKQGSGKSQLVALLLCILIGGLGIHRFYLGYTWQGIVQLLTAGGCGIWALIDLIRIITGDLKPKDGEYDKTL